MRPENGQTWGIQNSNGDTMYIVTLCPQPCAKGYFYILVLWDCGLVSLKTGEYTHLDAQFIQRFGTRLS